MPEKRSRLEEIVKNKKHEVSARLRGVSEAVLEDRAHAMPKTRDFAAALAEPRLNLIAEVKRMSPSAGVLRADVDPVEIAESYQAAGAAAVSVVTEGRYFGGRLGDVYQIGRAVKVPVLLKDFVLEKMQVFEARCAGADAVLLISSILDQPKLKALCRLCGELGLAGLVEVHDEEDVGKALAADADIVGINNRNLRTFETDLSVTERLMKRIPKGKTVVSESGVRDRKDVVRLENAGVDAILVGEALMKSADIEKKVKELLGEQ